MRQRLLVATRNAGKLIEYAEMLADFDVDWVTLDDVGITLNVEETGATFEANAILKAIAYAKASGLITMAEDSGLEVDALDGAPGIFTARYGGPGLSNVERYEYLLSKLINVPLQERTARFRCVIATVTLSNEVVGTANGTCEGVIALKPAGTGGFGYDPVFQLAASGLTMAQLDAKVKHSISHRGRALRAIEPLIREILS